MTRRQRERSDFLRYHTAAGVADFHALRHTFITNLARAGVHPKIAQGLARHSDINLTLRRYSHTVLSDRATAVAALPDLGAAAPVSVRTGTDDAASCCTDVARASDSDWRTIGSDWRSTDVVGRIADGA